MKTYRIYDVAKKFHTTNQIILSILSEFNISKKSYMSTINEKEYKLIQDYFQTNPDDLPDEIINKSKANILSKQPKLILNDTLKIKSLTIKSFRKFAPESHIYLNDILTLIVGQNATSKSTLLGMIAQPFEFSKQWKIYTPSYNEINKSKQKTILNCPYETEYSEIFRMSYKYDAPETNDYAYNIVLESKLGELKLPITMKKRTDQTDNKIRFVTGKTRNAGEGNYPHPLIYLGLNRLYPLANSEKIEVDPNYSLSIEEMNLYAKWQKQITLIPENITPEFISSDTKDFLACESEFYDAEANSAGQDNIGQILSAILSFRRLKIKLGEKYRGGILLIDEVDATLHTVAQENLIKVLIQSAKDYDLQIICTTHSTKMIELCSHKYKNESTIVSLFRRNGNILSDCGATYESIIAEINAVVSQKKTTTLLFEDTVASNFFNAITNNYFKDYINTSTYENNDKQDISLPADVLCRLASRNIPEFKKIFYIVDPDMYKQVPNNKNNILALPGKLPIEVMMYNFLHTEKCPFWDSSIGGYNYQMCFKDYPDLIYIPDDDDDKKEKIQYFKKWFNEQSSLLVWGRQNKKLYHCWIHNNLDLVKDFITNFVKKFNKIPPQIKIPNSAIEKFDNWLDKC
ncbi:Translation initiation factor IF-2, N-terminal region [Selenomonas ruminantium]|uniref:Translation initiation factor IF-2, N-terminal region n=1 Tax=Selenomonas ruminantium TaxID=971 RepID=A0A1M6WP17_SELRU|nr:translation initiation factor IF-2 N-terminal domain-containing protein [Selenomonas ruminantium]SHK95487.1 Translation initiation factor IF-2, N-terminal region [Selenomonas ruminantium]